MIATNIWATEQPRMVIHPVEYRGASDPKKAWGPMTLPAQNEVNSHDNGAAVLNTGGEERARKDIEYLECPHWNTKSDGLKRILDNALDDKLSKVGNTSIDSLVEKHEENQEPDLRIDESLANLVPLDSSLFEAELACSHDVIREEDEKYEAPDYRHTTTGHKYSLPDGKAVDLANSEESTRRKGTKVTPRRGQKQHTSPSNNTSGHHLGHARLLREEQPGVLSSHVGKVEDTSEPAVLVRGDARVGEEVEDGCVGQRILVDVLQHVGAHEQREEDHVDLADELFVECCVAEELVYVLVAEVVLAQKCLCGVELDDFAGGQGVELCHGDVLFCCCGFEGFVIGQLPCGLW
ncbi:hypothetical protein HG530_006674 [Fusarium avenaceum]|nr:hypothetical protein HG530_006674 [Fusarium avenaceum]